MGRGVAIALTLIFSVLVAVSSVSAQVIPPAEQPGHERFRFTEPPPVLSKPALPLIQFPSELAPAAAAKIKLKLQKITVEGSTVFKPADFEPLYAGLIGREVTAAEIYRVTSLIVEKYGQAGYSLIRAVVVPQAVDQKGATIRIRVIEGYIESVEWPEAAKRYRDLFSPCIAQMMAERPVKTGTIERCLLLASDIPGLKFTSTLKAGKHTDGGAVLVVALTEKPFDALTRLDNRGTPGRGPWEYLTSLTENNRLGLNESVNISYAAAFDSNELQYWSGNYHQVLTSDGLALDVNGSRSAGAPNLPSLTLFNFRGNSDTFDAGLVYPAIRSREQNLFVSGLVFAEHTVSDLLSTPNADDQLRGFRIRANYDQVDTWFGTVAQTQVISTFSQGINGLGSSTNSNPLASIAGGRVDFSKFEMLASRTQALAYGFSLYGGAFGQWSQTPLLIAEECGYGGQYFGRAFYLFELAGDRCLEELGELRYDLTIPRSPLSQTQLYGFIDHGDVERVDPSIGTAARMTGSSAGVGLRLAWKRDPASAIDNISLDVQAAKGFGTPGVDDAWQGFLILTARY
jgi:hemolysin activation/secretion protein